MADGRLALVGNCANTCMARLHTDGILDGTFGGGGIAPQGFGSPPQQVGDLKIIGSEIIVGGTLPSPDGSVDYAAEDFSDSRKMVDSFGKGGLAFSAFEVNSTSASPKSLLSTSRGLVISRLSQIQNNSGVSDKFGIARLAFDHIFRDAFGQ